MNNTIRISIVSVLCANALSGCLLNIREWTKAKIVITEIPLVPSEGVVGDDGWLEAKRLKIISNQDTSLFSLRFSKRSLFQDDSSLRIPYDPIPEWSMSRGALVVNNFTQEVVDYRQGGFTFYKDIELAAHRETMVSLEVRLLPVEDTGWISFCVSGYSHPDDGEVTDLSFCSKPFIVHPRSPDNKKKEPLSL
ncbi:MAG: hypothetical protein AAB400_04030 [Patescibacteria group bacterium]